jgi:uncharacterized protein (DUF2252 family)
MSIATADPRSSSRRVEHPSVAERSARGKAARAQVPRSGHGEWEPAADRPDPITLLEEQATSRVPELVPIRYGRMAVSPFTFYRGAAYVMASDLAATPRSGFRAQLCGDAHLSNFGAYAAPDRQLVFDLNDFDETLPGPWEWDVKRLAASLEIAGRDRGFARKVRRGVVTAAVGEYRMAMRGFAEMRNLDVWYARLNVDTLLDRVRPIADRAARKRLDRAAAKARRKDRLRALAKLTRMVDNEPRLVSDPPLVVPIEELLPDDDARELHTTIGGLVRDYRTTLPGELRELVEQYRYVDLARKVVGVGSVGTRAWIVLMLGRDNDDPLFLQVKEAQASVLEPFAGGSQYRNHGRRVVEGQRLMQAASDIMLGWIHVKAGIDGQPRDFYVRQLWDSKWSADVDVMDPVGVEAYGRACGWTLARAHARSGDEIEIAAYLGSGDSFDRAIARFSEAYADQNERDHAALLAAIESGDLTAETAL